jgi:hypothetical protein
MIGPGLILALTILAPIAGILAFIYLMIWLGKQDWGRSSGKPRRSGSVAGGVFSELQKLVEPQITHVQEHNRQQHATRDEQSASPDPPGP